MRQFDCVVEYKTGISWYWQLVSNGMTPNQGSIIELHTKNTHSQTSNTMSKYFGFLKSFLLWLLSFPLFRIKKKGSGIQYWYELDFFLLLKKETDQIQYVRQWRDYVFYWMKIFHWRLKRMNFFGKPKLNNNKIDKNMARGRCLHFKPTDRFLDSYPQFHQFHCGESYFIFWYFEWFFDN